MGAEEIIFEGNLEKKVERRKFPLGSGWKRKYCVLNPEAFVIYGTKSKAASGAEPSQTVPLSHISSIDRLYEDNSGAINYFTIMTEKRDCMTFRSKHETGWVAQIQIQLIHYKVRCLFLLFDVPGHKAATAPSL